jgi:hypothetical protein
MGNKLEIFWTYLSNLGVETCARKLSVANSWKQHTGTIQITFSQEFLCYKKGMIICIVIPCTCSFGKTTGLQTRKFIKTITSPVSRLMDLIENTNLRWGQGNVESFVQGSMSYSAWQSRGPIWPSMQLMEKQLYYARQLTAEFDHIKSQDKNKFHISVE